MKEVEAAAVTQLVAALCEKANKLLPQDLEDRVASCCACERNALAKSILGDLQRNMDAARKLNIPVCQDTGMAVVFAEVGQDVHINGNFEDAVNDGVRLGYTRGYLRKSVVRDPLFDRVNTNDNTPAVLHTRLVPGDSIRLTVAPKGFGSENMSALKMFTPAASAEDVIDFVVDTVKKAGSNPCPPVCIGVGIGGDFELCALLAKKALCRSISEKNANADYAQMEETILQRLNRLNIGPQGFGGDTTALSVAIETYPTHIAGLPVAVNVGCHVTRHCSGEIE